MNFDLMAELLTAASLKGVRIADEHLAIDGAENMRLEGAFFGSGERSIPVAEGGRFATCLHASIDLVE